MSRQPANLKLQNGNGLYDRIREILESARTNVTRTVNTTQVVANWLVGREIVEEQQEGETRAAYGNRVVEGVAARLQKEYGKGYSALNLWLFRNFFVEYPALLSEEILYAVRKELTPANVKQIPYATRKESATIAKRETCKNSHAVRVKSAAPPWISGVTPQTLSDLIPQAVSAESWQPGRLHPNLSWTHYRTLLRVDRPEARAFYEIETLKNNWATRELERQVSSLLYERLALSKDKKGLMRLATKGQDIQQPADVFKDPVVMEFLGLPESPRLVESKLEEALLSNLQSFLLELGKGFAFVARQERITLDGDHFYIDLVFYHTILKCYVLIDLKVDKLTHTDLGQIQLYVNYFDQERRTEGDNPTLGLILCTDKNDAVVKYTLGLDQKKIFASRYKLHLPTEAELRKEIRREIRQLTGAQSPRTSRKRKS